MVTVYTRYSLACGHSVNTKWHVVTVFIQNGMWSQCLYKMVCGHSDTADNTCTHATAWHVVTVAQLTVRDGACSAALKASWNDNL